MLVKRWLSFDVGEDELTSAERKARRNAKKKRGAKTRNASGSGRKHRLELAKAGNKLQPTITEAVPGAGKSLSSSTKFFKELKQNKDAPGVKKHSRKTDKSASHFKL